MVKTADGRILEGWAKGVTPEGLPYYANHCHQITQWDHPEYVRIVEDLGQFNAINYAAYRTAFKIKTLQSRFKINEASIHCVSAAFGNCNLRTAENADYVSIVQIEKIIFFILKMTHKHKAIDIALCTDLIVNFLLNAFDQDRSGYLKVLSCKVLLTVLCGSRLQEKYHYLFSQIADHNNCCTRKKLACLLRDLSKIPELLSEHPSFGVTYVPAAVDSCFSDIEGDVGITEDIFLNWLHQEPQTLVWWTTLYRLSSAEFVCHDVKCNVCKQKPILGMRYQCLRCINFNLCQECFLHGTVARGHKNFHPIQEYCHESTAREWRKAFVKSLMHWVRGSREMKPRYLSLPATKPANTLGSLLINESGTEAVRSQIPPGIRKSPDGNRSSESDSCHSEELETDRPEHVIGKLTRPNLLRLAKPGSANSCDASILQPSQRRQIQSIVLHLEEGQRQLAEQLETSGNPIIPSHCIEDHNTDLQTQINKLKLILQNYSKASQKNGRLKKELSALGTYIPCMESTPVTSERGGGWPNLSPIGPQVVHTVQSIHSDSVLLDNKENHFAESQKTCDENFSESRNLFSLENSVEISSVTFGTTSHDTSTPAPNALPGFSEIGSIELSTVDCPSKDSDSQPSCDLAPQSPFRDVRRVVRLREEETEVVEIQEELEKMLRQLSQLFPLKSNGEQNCPDGVITAANEIGDILSDYVSNIPSQVSSASASRSSD